GLLGRALADLASQGPAELAAVADPLLERALAGLRASKTSQDDWGAAAAALTAILASHKAAAARFATGEGFLLPPAGT
ncbi:unnamed protein product, partial [Heterosigma akashiwo]